MGIFYCLLTIVSIPPWCIGDLLEWIALGNRPFENPVDPLPTDGPSGLDPLKTQYMGASISTYQYSSDPEFCKRSDWGRYNETHFQGEDQHKAFGQGVDILTENGRAAILHTLQLEESNALRFSVEWADIMNDDGSFNDVAMQRYVEAAKVFKDQEIELFITLHHFTTPLDEAGHSLFESPSAIDKFVDYAAYVYENMRPYATKFVTFNEPNVNGVENYILGDFPALGKGNFWKHTQVVRTMLEAHKRVYDKLHTLAGDTKVEVGITHQALRFIPGSRWNIFARIISYVFTYVFHESFLQWAEANRSKLDFLGVQYYTMPYLAGFPPDSTCGAGEMMVDVMRFRFYPQGILSVLEEVADRLGNDIPLLVTETGTAGPNHPDIKDEMDERRATYFRQSLAAACKAQEKLHLIGYLYWGIFKNFEWAHGFGDQDFGNYLFKKEISGVSPTEGALVIQEAFKTTRAARAAMEEKRRSA